MCFWTSLIVNFSHASFILISFLFFKFFSDSILFLLSFFLINKCFFYLLYQPCYWLYTIPPPSPPPTIKVINCQSTFIPYNQYLSIAIHIILYGKLQYLCNYYHCVCSTCFVLFLLVYCCLCFQMFAMCGAGFRVSTARLSDNDAAQKDSGDGCINF